MSQTYSSQSQPTIIGKVLRKWRLWSGRICVHVAYTIISTFNVGLNQVHETTDCLSAMTVNRKKIRVKWDPISITLSQLCNILVQHLCPFHSVEPASQKCSPCEESTGREPELSYCYTPTKSGFVYSAFVSIQLKHYLLTYMQNRRNGGVIVILIRRWHGNSWQSLQRCHWPLAVPSHHGIGSLA